MGQLREWRGFIFPCIWAAFQLSAIPQDAFSRIHNVPSCFARNACRYRLVGRGCGRGRRSGLLQALYVVGLHSLVLVRQRWKVDSVTSSGDGSPLGSCPRRGLVGFRELADDLVRGVPAWLHCAVFLPKSGRWTRTMVGLSRIISRRGSGHVRAWLRGAS